MEYKTTVIQKAEDLVSQYDHFFATVKERAASYYGNAASVSRSIEADFEALRIMLEQRRNALLAEVQEEITASRGSDIFELEAKQRNMHSSLQQLQQLAAQGLLAEDNRCYQQLLNELSEAKQKLKETSDKFQIKFEGFLKPVASKVANYGQVVCGCERRGDEQTSLPTAVKCGVDFGQVFAALSSQFEARCQLQATRQEVKSFSDNKQNPLSGWYEYSKKLQWRHTPTISPATSEGAAVPDFASIIRKMKDDFTNHVNSAGVCLVTNELYEKWLVPRVEKQPEVAAVSSKWLITSERITPSDDAVTAVTKGFNSIASTDTSMWLLHSSSDDGMLSESHDHFIGDTSPWLLQSPSVEKQDKLSMTVAQEQDYSEWLNPVKELENCQTWLTATTDNSQPTEVDDVSNWLYQGYSWSDQSNEQWLLPSGNPTACNEMMSLLPRGGANDDEILSDAFGSTQTLTSFGSSDFEVVDDTDL